MNDLVTDEDLMRLLQKGQQSALGVLYQRHSNKVWTYIVRRVPGTSAEDLYQDCFVKLVEKRHSWNNQPFVLWLYVVLRNLIMDYYRRHKSEMKLIEKLAPAEYELANQADFNELVSTMPPETSKLLKEFFNEGWSYKELAERYESSELSIRKRMSRAIALLRKEE